MKRRSRSNKSVGSADLRSAGALFAPSARTQLGNAARGFAMVAEISDSDLGEVRQSEDFFQAAEATLGKLHHLLDKGWL